MSVTAPGLPALQADLSRLAEQVSDTTDPDRAATQLLAREVKARAPRRTGYLAATVTAMPTSVEVFARYAPFVAARNPFLPAAVTAAGPRVEDIYADHLEEALPAALDRSY